MEPRKKSLIIIIFQLKRKKTPKLCDLEAQKPACNHLGFTKLIKTLVDSVHLQKQKLDDDNVGQNIKRLHRNPWKIPIYLKSNELRLLLLQRFLFEPRSEFRSNRDESRLVTLVCTS